jgi:CRP-like cAMP-binding protein
MPEIIDPAAVRRFRCFQAFSEAEVRAMLALLEPVACAAGQLLFRQGDAGDALYLLVSGQVAVRINVPDQEEPVDIPLEAGSLFGEMSPLLGEPRTASVVARTASELWRLPAGPLQAALGRGESWASKFLFALAQVLARRLVAMNRQVIGLIADLRKKEGGALGPGKTDAEQLADRLFNEELLGLVRRAVV